MIDDLWIIQWKKKKISFLKRVLTLNYLLFKIFWNYYLTLKINFSFSDSQCNPTIMIQPQMTNFLFLLLFYRDLWIFDFTSFLMDCCWILLDTVSVWTLMTIEIFQFWSKIRNNLTWIHCLNEASLWFLCVHSFLVFIISKYVVKLLFCEFFTFEFRLYKEFCSNVRLKCLKFL